MKKLAVYIVLGVLIGLVGFLGFKYFQRGNKMVPISIGTTNPPAGALQGPAPKTNPRIEPILETAQTVNVDSYTPEQARLRDFFQSGSTLPVQDEQAAVPGKTK